jgi:hypothetical protein
MSDLVFGFSGRENGDVENAGGQVLSFDFTA